MKYLTVLYAIGMIITAYPVMAQETGDSLDIPTVNLDELVIEAKKSVIVSDGAKLTYDMTEDESSKGQTLMDALKKVPMVTIDGNDQIKINGSSNFKIYVNGHEDQMLEANYARMFKSMPAESVQKIEVITEPGAKYDAEGVGGILNLITEQKQRKDGYAGGVSLGYGNQQAYASIFGTARVDKVTADVNVNYADNGAQPQGNKTHNATTYLKNDLDHQLVTDGRQDINFNFVQASLNLGWEPTARDLFNFGGSVNDIKGYLDNFFMNNAMYDRAGNKRWSYNDLYYGYVNVLGSLAHFSYRHGFNEENTHKLMIGYQFNYGYNTTHLDIERSDMENFTSDDLWRYLYSTIFNREHTAQLDYSNPFGGSKHLLEAGLKGIFRRNSANSLAGNGATWEDMVPDDDNSSNSLQSQDIYAAYASYTGNFGNVSVTGGLRYEHTRMGFNNKMKQAQNFVSHLNDWVPNAAVTYSFSPAHNIRLAYQMRISRPSIDQMNPFRMEYTEYNSQAGNPHLTSARNNTLTLTYTNFQRILGGNISLQYSNTSNAISQWSYMQDNMIVDSYANIGYEQYVRLNGFLNINASNRMQISLNGSVAYCHLNAPSINVSNHGWTGNYNINWNYRGPGDVNFGAYGGQSFREITLQGWNGGYHWYGVSVGRDFLKDKTLSVVLTGQNMFESYIPWKDYKATSTYISDICYKNRAWGVCVSVTWRFGKLQEKVKQTGIDLNSDDKADTGSSRKGISR